MVEELELQEIIRYMQQIILDIDTDSLDSNREVDTWHHFSLELAKLEIGFGFGREAGDSGPSLPSAATGGTKYTYNSKTIHAFTTTGPNPFIAPKKNFTAEVFVVGGGGGGATDMAGGGGAGGVRNLSSVYQLLRENMLSQLVLVVMEQDKIVLLILEQHLDKEMILVSEV